MTDEPLIDLDHLSDAAEAVGARDFADICAMFAAELPGYVEGACAADPEDARRHLHALSGAAVNCGAARLAGLARRLERSADLTDGDREALRATAEDTRRWFRDHLESALDL